ncbi:hypothetical protein D3C87_2161270 [compost metagenome]
MRTQQLARLEGRQGARLHLVGADIDLVGRECIEIDRLQVHIDQRDARRLGGIRERL